MQISIRPAARIVIVALAAGVSARVWHTLAKEPSQDNPVSSAAASPITPGQATSAARAWLDALKVKDAAKLAQKTQFPFAYRSTSLKKLCEGTAANANNLAAIVDCLVRRDKLLLQELRYAEGLGVNVIETARVPTKFSKLIGKPPDGGRLVRAFINGDGINFELMLVVVPDGHGSGAVKAFLVSAEVEAG